MKSSNRIVFLGNSLMEEAASTGILEMMFLNVWPEAKLTFRNLGWSGDTVDGKSRNYFSKPPEPYDLMIRQIDTLHPSIVVLGYGNVEAYNGAEGLETFKKDLLRLIEDIKDLGAKPVLLSTIPQIPDLRVDQNLEKRNADLKLYASQIKMVADSLGHLYVEVFDAFQSKGASLFRADGVQLNEIGYFELGKILLKGMGKEIPDWRLTVDIKSGKTETTPALDVTGTKISRDGFEMQTKMNTLPVFAGGQNVLKQIVTVHGLRKGVYQLTVNGETVAVGSSAGWAKGMEINQGPVFTKATEIQNKIKEINDLYFQEYRPLNRTYLVGFRRYEQGQNSYELGIYSLIAERLEEQIFRNLKTVDSQVFELVRVR